VLLTEYAVTQTFPADFDMREGDTFALIEPLAEYEFNQRVSWKAPSLLFPPVAAPRFGTGAFASPVPDTAPKTYP